MMKDGMEKKKSKSKPQTVVIQLYPFDPENSETAILTEHQLILISYCLAPRIKALTPIGTKPDPAYRFKGESSDKSRFNDLFLKFVIKKNVYGLDGVRTLTFFELIGILKREIRRREVELVSRWRNRLNDALETGRMHLGYWQAQVWKVIELFKNCNESRLSDETSKQVPLPYISLEWRGNDIFDWRPPTEQELSWMYLVLGWKMQLIFAIDGLFIPFEAEQAVSEFGKYTKEYVYDPVINASFEDFRDWWSLVRADLDAKAGLSKAKKLKKSRVSRQSKNRKKKTSAAQQKKRKKPPLLGNDMTVLKLLENLPERKGLTGKEILQVLDKKEIFIDQSTLTKSIIPRLQHNGYRIKNRRDGAGYYIEK